MRAEIAALIGLYPSPLIVLANRVRVPRCRGLKGRRGEFEPMSRGCSLRLKRLPARCALSALIVWPDVFHRTECPAV